MKAPIELRDKFCQSPVLRMLIDTMARWSLPRWACEQLMATCFLMPVTRRALMAIIDFALEKSVHLTTVTIFMLTAAQVTQGSATKAHRLPVSSV